MFIISDASWPLMCSALVSGFGLAMLSLWSQCRFYPCLSCGFLNCRAEKTIQFFFWRLALRTVFLPECLTICLKRYLQLVFLLFFCFFIHGIVVNFSFAQKI